MMLPDASLIVCSRNRPALLTDTVASVLGGDHVPSELVIVDQSDRADPELATRAGDRGCRIRYLWTRSRGLSRASNVGIHAATHDVLVFTHDDVLVTPTWYETLVRALVRVGPDGVVTGQVLPSQAERPGGIVPTLKVDPTPATYEGRIDADVLLPLNMAMYRSVVTRIGTFDERLGPGTFFPGGEDNDFGFRLLEAGLRIHYVPEAMLYHRAWRSDVVALRYAYGRGQGGYLAKHASFRDPYMLRRLQRSFVGHGRAFLYDALRGNRFAPGNLAYATGLLVGAAAWLATR
jgi:GT2 family glycosyltransferase